MDKLSLFIALTAVAITLQAGLLLAMFIIMRGTASRMEALANEVKTKVFPIADQTQSMMVELRPTIEQIAAEVKETTTVIRSQIERTDAVVNDVVDRARLQVIRADELLTRTMDRVEHTSEVVQKTVMSPVRQFSGLMEGISVGLSFLFAHRGQQNGSNNRRGERRPVPQDEMFI